MFASKDIFLKSSGGGYQISRSVRLRSSASAYLNRTPASASNRKTFTFSAWLKRGQLGSSEYSIFTGYTDANNRWLVRFESDTFRIFWNVAGTSNELITSAIFRDPSAWYHFVVAVDTTQATNTNRIKVYVNGVEQTLTGTYIPQNTDTQWNNNVVQQIGRKDTGGGFFDGYITEINSIDGQALTPSSFGETNAVTGVWQPKAYSGTYGTNGFELNFSDNSAATAAAIGKDYSGNGNNWTPNNISVTAGTTYDSMLDVPTLYADGGNGRGNYAVLNPLSLGSTVTLSNGNLTMTEVGTYATTVSSIGVTSGKWYAEMTVGSNTYAGTCGVARLGYSPTSRLGFQANTWAYNSDGGLYYNSTQLTPTQATFTTGDVIGIELDVDNLTIKFYKNNTLQTQFYTAANSGLTAGEFYFATGHINSTSNWNFGQRPFSYTPPTGFVALNTQNLPTPTISNGATVMAATLYTGTGATQSISNSANGVSFQPDFVWVKKRSGAEQHELQDSVRGATKRLASNLTDAETTVAGSISSFNSNGFTVVNAGSTNENGFTYVGWQWNAGGSTVTNTSGSISAQVRANATAGFSVVTYTGTGAAATVGHGLGVAPRMIIVKGRSTAGDPWAVYHASLANTQYLYLNTTAAVATGVNLWNSTTPTSSVFSVGASQDTNRSAGTLVAYCFAAVAGYSAFGSYTGNGSADGPFVFTGFRPRFVMIRNPAIAANWLMFDSSRDTYNPEVLFFFANTSDAEQNSSGSVALDFVSNGFKIRQTSGNINGSGNSLIYMAFAENPFKLSLAR